MDEAEEFNDIQTLTDDLLAHSERQRLTLAKLNQKCTALADQVDVFQREVRYCHALIKGVIATGQVGTLAQDFERDRRGRQ